MLPLTGIACLWVIQRGRVELIKFEIGTRQPARHAIAMPSPEEISGWWCTDKLLKHRRLPVPLLLRAGFNRFFISVPYPRANNPSRPGRPILSETIRSTALLRSSSEYSDGSAPCSPALFLLLYRGVGGMKNTTVTMSTFTSQMVLSSPFG